MVCNIFVVFVGYSCRLQGNQQTEQEDDIISVSKARLQDPGKHQIEGPHSRSSERASRSSLGLPNVAQVQDQPQVDDEGDAQRFTEKRED